MQDIWALGVISYEALTGERGVSALGGIETILELADGEPYPWEASQPPPSFAKSRVRAVVDMCLKRDPSHRASAAQVLVMIDQIGQRTNTTSL